MNDDWNIFADKGAGVVGNHGPFSGPCIDDLTG